MNQLKTIRISVTKKDIELGYRMSCRNCPVARAINRRVKPEAMVSTDRVNFGGSAGWVELPSKVINWIIRFDHGPLDMRRYVKPITFRLTIPMNLLK